MGGGLGEGGVREGGAAGARDDAEPAGAVAEGAVEAGNPGTGAAGAEGAGAVGSGDEGGSGGELRGPGVVLWGRWEVGAEGGSGEGKQWVRGVDVWMQAKNLRPGRRQREGAEEELGFHLGTF